MNLRNQRTGRVNRSQTQSSGTVMNRGTDSVRREDDPCAGRDLLFAVDEDRTSRLQVTHDVDVVDDLLAHINRRTPVRERDLDRLHRTFDPGAIATRRNKQKSSHPNSMITNPRISSWFMQDGRQRRAQRATPAAIPRARTTSHHRTLISPSSRLPFSHRGFAPTRHIARTQTKR
jgi:hypothetical protein